MTELLTSAQMRAVEGAAIALGAVTGLELMERAGRGVFEAIFEEWPELAAATFRAVVLCGPGNNGGDGFVVARLLREWGWAVEVFLLGDAAKLPPDARVNYERWCRLEDVGDLACADLSRGDGCALVVDALFGTGLTRPFEGAGRDQAAYAMRGAGRFAGARTVAVDVPSGLCADSGRWLGAGFEGGTGLTVSFHRAKLGHYLGAGPEACQRLRVKDIGLSGLGEAVRLCGTPEGLAKGPQGYKFSHGHSVILAGGEGQGGAARLAARGALRVGSGLVTVGCPPAAVNENAARLDAVMLRPVHDADALVQVLEDRRINALCLGPGMGTGEREAALLEAVLMARGSGKRPGVVLDADALTMLARDAELFGRLHAGCVLTPHWGEFARLFPDIAARLAEPAMRGPAFSKVDACREAAARAGCVVLLKGADTVIADPQGRCAVNAASYGRAAPWLATAGAGDVLAGFIVGLLARGFAPMRAAEVAAWLHVECARSFGPGLIAEDLPEELPKVFCQLGL